MRVDAGEFSPGAVILLDGQRFEMAAVVPHLRLDGSEIELLAWRSHCPDCDDVFETSSPRLITSLNRRCAGCRRRGARVLRTGNRRITTKTLRTGSHA